VKKGLDLVKARHPDIHTFRFVRTTGMAPSNKQHRLKVTRTEVTMKDDISVLIREAQIFLDEEDTFMSKVSQGASNLMTGIKDLGKSLFSAPKPAGATAPGFAPTDTSTKAVVQTKLDTVLGQASKAAGATTPATAPASTPMRNSVANMINRIVEGTFDWKELERLYGGDFAPFAPESGSEHGAHVDHAKDLLKSHGYEVIDDNKSPTFAAIHPEGHSVDYDKESGEWQHHTTSHPEAVWGSGISELGSHLHSFFRAW